MAKIIKGGPLPSRPTSSRATDGGKVIEQEVLLGHEEARRIVEQAQARARAIVEEAAAQAGRLAEQGKKSGYAEGLAQWETRILEVRELAERQIADARPQLVALALKVAEKILRTHLAMEPGAVVPMIEEALAAVGGFRGGHLLLRLHPRDIPAVEEHYRPLIEHDPRFSGLQILSDESLAQGGCRVETDFGSVDASVETQLQAIENLLHSGGTPE